MISIAHKLNLKELEEGIMEGLMNDLSEDNVIDILNLNLKDKDLLKKIDDFLLKETIKIFQHESFLNLNEKKLIEIISKNEIK